MAFKKEVVFKFRPGFILATAIRLSPEDQEKWNAPEFIVFQARLTPMFEIEQVGSGFPCKDEAKAKEIFSVIEAKNENTPIVVLASWDGGFFIATVKNPEAFYDELVLFHFNKPQKFGKQLSLFSLRHFKCCLGKPREMIKEEMLPTMDEAVAQKLLQQRSDELKAEEAAKHKESIPTSSISPPSSALKKSQLMVLSKAFPETAKILQGPSDAKPKYVYAAYQRDIFRMTEEMDEPLTFNQEQFYKTVKALNNSRRRKKMGIDPIEYELVAGWIFRGYGKMTPMERVIALKKRRLHPLSHEAIRKLCKRLKLPSLRKPGYH